ncbi:SpoIIE family protein phosphatase, partial [Streptomyces scabiei]|uniref:SpoIIE family protein phosphatase n=1 Tax=Streptomyces scabiei TaxID=1930 RepID=UPI0015C51031
AAVCRVRTTALFAALSLLMYFVGDSSWPHQYRNGLPDFVLVALGGILSVLACAVRLRGQERMMHMRAVVDTTRRILLRQLPPDVQGKGLAAVEAASVLLGTFREAAYYESDPVTVAERLETRMVRHVRYCAHVGRDDSERFATAVLLDFPELRSVRTDWGPDLTGLDSLTVDVINFGHEPPLLVSPAGV